MTTTTLKNKIQKRINEIEDDKVLQAVYTILNSSKSSTDFWDNLTKQQQADIDKAIKEADEGKLTPHTTVMKKLRSK